MLQKRPNPRRKPTNLSIDANLIAEAKKLDVNVSRAAETGIAKAVSEERSRQWKAENREAIESLNDWVEKNGIPLEEFRQF